jgi:hypothetical protein
VCRPAPCRADGRGAAQRVSITDFTKMSQTPAGRSKFKNKQVTFVTD